jgi:glycogen synthase
MHLLMTSDTVGGVWTYTRELVSGLLRRGNRVTLVSFGGIPLPHQTIWMDGLEELDYRPTAYKLEWMQDSERDVHESGEYLEAVIREVRPDLLHLNQYCYGTVSPQLPRIVVAHSDVVSWWIAVHGREPDDNPWIRWYRRTVMSGLSCADLVIAPSEWMLDQLQEHYASPGYGMVVHNGLTPSLFIADSTKENFAISVGRLWDAGKHVSLLLERDYSAQICIVGTRREPGKELDHTAEAEYGRPRMQFHGAMSQDQLRELYGRAAMYVATSRYEPFGLAPLEAAFSRCAVIANDLPVFHELWGDAACYFRRNDPQDLEYVLGELSGSPELREHFATLVYNTACERFTADRMVENYANAYETVAAPEQVA